MERPLLATKETMWRKRYRVLFDRNVAGIVLTNSEGRILDCNERCARIFGFDSCDEMLLQTAWDFYFDRAEREALIDRLRARRNCRAEELCLRGKNGVPVWVLATSSVVSFSEGGPELLQGTLIDITQQKKAQARSRDIANAASSAMTPRVESARTFDLCETLATLLRRVSQTIEPDNLPRIDRGKIQECLRTMEQMKMLIAELEILHLPRE